MISFSPVMKPFFLGAAATTCAKSSLRRSPSPPQAAVTGVPPSHVKRVVEQLGRITEYFKSKNLSEQVAEDLQGRVILQLLLNPHVDEKKPYLHYVLKVCRTTLINYWTRSATEARYIREQRLPGNRGFQVALENKLWVEQAIATLTPRDQELLNLSYWQELSPSEIAAELGLTIDAANQALSRARARLKKALFSPNSLRISA